MVAKSSLSALSGWVYRRLRLFGISPSWTPLQLVHRFLTVKEPWRETKFALMDEISAQRRSGPSIFARELLDRINQISEPPNPFAAALFLGAPIPTNHSVGDIGPKPDLTQSQQESLDKARSSSLLFLLGAPGTGKSKVTRELIDELTKDKSVLFCCSTRAALENASRELEQDHPSLTLNTISGLIRSQHQRTFDTVIIDEAGMVNLAQVLYLTSLTIQKIIFVGDPFQLPPISSTESPWNSENIFSHQARSKNLSEIYVWQQQHPEISALLKEQFDIPERLFNVLNHFCYGGRLTNRSNGKGHITFIDSAGLGAANTGKRSSPTNEVHANLVIETLSQVLGKQSVKPEHIGVLTPFTAQASFLEKRAKAAGLPQGIEFGTVHTFQGRLKNCLILDTTAAGVDYTYQNLADNNQARALMNSALSRCRTIGGTEGRLIVIADMGHIRQHYTDSTALQFLNRLYFRADILEVEGVQKYGQATSTLVELFLADWSALDTALASGTNPKEEEVKTLIYNACDLIPRLIALCNRIRPKSFDVGSALSALEKPYAALALANLSEESQFDPERLNRFKGVITDLYKVIYESTMVVIPGEHRNRGPEKPIYDPNAEDGASYGRVRLWVRELRNYYQHDNEKPEDYRQDFSKQQRDYAFMEAIGRAAPNDQQNQGNVPEDYSGIEYLRVTLVLLKETVDYLNTVRERL